MGDPVLCRRIVTQLLAGPLVEAGFFWLRYLDGVIPPSCASEGACGVWFISSRTETEMTPRQAIAYYKGAKR